MKYSEIIKVLESIGVDDPQTEALVILESLFGASRAIIMADKEREYNSSALDSLLEQREKRIPLQYILGEWEFMGKKFYVSCDCLIPRPDTEILVEKALEILKKRTQGGVFQEKCKMQNAKCKITPHPSAEPTPSPQGEGKEGTGVFENGLDVADLCTGSGCIGLSLLMYGDIEKMTLMDISCGALKMAQKNAELHGLSNMCEFIEGDITKEMPKRKFDLIVSNPPYIPSKDIEALSEEVKKEPMLALDGGDDGLDIIRFLIGDGLSYLKENGAMLIEFGYDQGEIMDTLLRQKRDTGSIKSYEILHDYGNNPRVACVYK